MPLTDDEAESAFRVLSNALRELEFGWVTNQVEEKLALGKVQAKKLRAREFPEPTDSFLFVHEPRRAMASKSTFTVSQRFSGQERLRILLDAIELAIPVIGEVAANAFGNLEEFGIQSAVSFAPEAEVADEFILDAATVQQRIAAGTQLRTLIDELRRELESANETQSSS